MNKRASIHLSTRTQGQQKVTKIISYCVHFLHKEIFSCKLDDTLSQNGQKYDEIINFIENTMENWRMELTAKGKNLPEV